MLNKINISSREWILIVSIVLAALTLAVYWQVNQYDFVLLDDKAYVYGNIHIQSGITLDGFRWAFTSTASHLWNPMIWLSLMFDYQLFCLNAGGYHMTNLILHIINTLLLFWLFNRMTGAIWKSAFVAALFALHPLHVESVAWVSERKDVLSTFFWMLTLCLYVYYTEKTAIKRYLLVLFSFVLALMSKPMVITLPIIMILLDYWPLKRFESIKGSLIIWQLREKSHFFVLSAVLSIISIYTMYEPTIKYFPLGSRFANAPVSFVTYLEKTFWPHDMAVFYPYSNQLAVWQVMGSVLLIILICIAAIAMMKRMPYLFVGWLWYAITILPVIGIIQNGDYAMADRYHYVPSIGIAVMLTWGIPFLINSEDIRKKILFPAGIAVLVILSVLTWRQCGYWKNSIELFTHAVKVTKDNYKAYSLLGHAYSANGQYQQAIDNFSEVIRLKANYKMDYLMALSGRGIAYIYLKQYQRAIEDFNKAISLKPDYINPYNYRGKAYSELGQYKSAIEDYSTAIRLKPDYTDAYNNRGDLYLNQGNKKLGCPDAQKACALGNCKLLEMAKGKGDCL